MIQVGLCSGVLSDRCGDRMGRLAFYGSDQLYKFFFGNARGNNLLYLKYPFGQGSGFIHHHGINFCHHIQEIRTFKQDSVSRSQSDSSKITQWNRNDQGTWATDHQEDQAAIEPLFKTVIGYNEIGKGNHKQGKEEYNWCIYLGKTGNE
ncbi:hypothetical protein D3C85_1240000 [compost metagenome]